LTNIQLHKIQKVTTKSIAAKRRQVDFLAVSSYHVVSYEIRTIYYDFFLGKTMAYQCIPLSDKDYKATLKRVLAHPAKAQF